MMKNFYKKLKVLALGLLITAAAYSQFDPAYHPGGVKIGTDIVLDSIYVSGGETILVIEGNEFNLDDIAAGSPGVTSVALSLPSQFTITGSPVTVTGTLTGAWADTLANYVFAGPTAGGAGIVRFRVLVDADIAESLVTQHEGAIDHDQLTNFAENEHRIWEITGTQDIHADRISESSVTQHEAAIDHDALTNTHNMTSDLLTWLDNLIPGLSDIDSVDIAGDASKLTFWDNSNPYVVSLTSPPETYDTTNWYFSNTGNNANNGHSTDYPKETLAELESLVLDPGDSVFFNKSDTWRATHNADGGGETPGLEMSTRGESGNHIVFTSYGAGDKPRLLGSNAPISWTDNGSNVWYATVGYDMTTYGSVWFVNTDESIHWGTEVGGVVSVNDAYEFYQTGGTLYVYSTSDPASAFNSVEVPQITYLFQFSVRFDSAEYNTIDGIELAYAGKNGVHMEWPGGINGQSRTIHGLEVRNCDIHHIGTKDNYGYGIWSTYSTAIFEDNEINDMGRRGISLSANGSENQDTMWNVHIRDNYFHTGWHTTGVDIINDGDGLIMDSVNVYRNIIEDSKTIAVGGGLTSNGMYIELDAGGYSAVKLINSYIYNNLFKYSKGKGIQLVNNENTSNLYDNVFIHNNVLYDFNDNVVDYGLIHLDSLTNGGDWQDVFIRNNITYSSNSSNYNVMLYNWTGYGVTMDYNLHYVTHGSSCFNADGSNYTLAQWSNWKTATGWETNSPNPTNPLFYNAPDNLKVNVASDAVDGGVDITSYTHDIDEVAVGSPPNIGAYEGTQD